MYKRITSNGHKSSYSLSTGMKMHIIGTLFVVVVVAVELTRGREADDLNLVTDAQLSKVSVEPTSSVDNALHSRTKD
jgi:hypothetical protein